MFKQFFMPLELHFDGGFHATGDAFKAAAEKLSETTDRMPVSNQQLSESAQEYTDDTLKEAVNQTTVGIWLMYCEDKSISLQRGALQEETK